MEWLVYEGKAALVLDAILAEHAGRPVVVDIWATWCTPCLAGIKALEPLKTTDYADVGFNEEKLKNLIDKVLK